MGVPAFFRWLTRKYPSVIVHCVEEKSLDVNGVRIPIDSSQPNPNGVEFDNLYLDMNGIIHPCTHPEDRPAPRNEDEMMVAIFECIDRMFNIVRPRKLLYMAIDGVAPRAKMNQQRSRRFRSSKESVEKMSEIKRIRNDLILRGAQLADEKPKEEHFDSNCITPGTPFMARLSECLHYYIHERLNNDPGWKDVKVILSDANVPGEGEHKIMDFIRKQRAQPDHDPNTQHCLCGADADLIMLGLATHEPNFTIIREEFKPNKPRPCDICGQLGHEMKDCIGNCAPVEQDSQKIASETEYIFVRLNILKEYLEKELQMPNLPFKYDFERAVDDWVFMCFFVGNDFLPHLPSLEIREGAIDRLVSLYKDCVYKTGGWLTDSGDVNLERVQLIMKQLGAVEDEIFKTRQKKELEFKAREKAKKRRLDGYNQYRPNWDLVKNTQFAPMALGKTRTVVNARQEAYEIRRAGMHTEISTKTEIISEDASTDTVDNANIPDTDNRRGVKRKIDESELGDDDDDDYQANDEVRLWEAGFKDRYYESKFDVGPDNREFRNQVALHYVRGLCWVLRYYYQGCASWKWYFPYHYAPFASDFVHISGLSTEFEEDTEPFRPLEQLMSVFPAASSKHVPAPWATLMSDPESSIIDFYPEDFKIDLNGKKFAWQGVALLPFVEEERLFKALEPYYEQLTPEEKQRNVRGDDRLYVSMSNQNYNLLRELYTKKISKKQEVVVTMEGMRGTVLISKQCITQGGYLDSPVVGLDPVNDNSVCCVRFRDPEYTKGYIFSSKKLKGANDPPKVLKPADLDPQTNRNWRAQIGMAPATQRANLGEAGHRMLNHRLPKEPGIYSNVPPPRFENNRRYQNYNRNNSGPLNRRGVGYNTYNNAQQNYHQRNYQQQYRNYNSGGYSGHWIERNSGYNQQNYGNYSNNYNSGGNYYQDRNQYGPDRNQQQGRNNQQNEERSPYRMPGPYKDAYIPSTAWGNSQ